MFECKICNYSSLRSNDIKRHEQTKKHILKSQNNLKEDVKAVEDLEEEDVKAVEDLEQVDIIVTKKRDYICTCNKIYTSRQHLWRHKKICKFVTDGANLNDVLEEQNVESTDNKLLTNALNKIIELNDQINNQSDQINTQSDEINCLKAQLEKLRKSTIPKQSIPKALKRQVWTHWIGRELGIAKCLCCQISDIEKDTFSCGHIIAEKNGGALIVENLKPICMSCNSSMGTTNMDVFIKKFKLNEFKLNDKKMKKKVAVLIK
jgi:5-methylcytosine-specific restriction endonuclease McrA